MENVLYRNNLNVLYVINKSDIQYIYSISCYHIQFIYAAEMLLIFDIEG